MGRKVKRVPLGFDWPIGKIWYGYRINSCLEGEDGMTCDDCRAFAKAKGLKMTSHDCPVFECLEPPKGEGWQMWETVSEGSPISPVLETPELLAKWLAENKASSFGKSIATEEQWLAMIKGPGWAMSAVLDSKGFHSGVEDIGDLSS